MDCWQGAANECQGRLQDIIAESCSCALSEDRGCQACATKRELALLQLPQTSSNTAAAKNIRLAALLRVAPLAAQCFRLATTQEAKDQVSHSKQAEKYIPCVTYT